MNGQAASVGALLSVLVLNDHRVTSLAWSTPFTMRLSEPRLREQTYLAFQPWAARLPDHVFDSAWRLVRSSLTASSADPVTPLIALADEFLVVKHGDVWIRRNMLGAWQQGIASRMSVLPIRAAAELAGNEGHRRGYRGRRSAADDGFHSLRVRASPQIFPLITPYEASIADYIEREGLHETHLHLNGSTFAELCWLRALACPEAEVRKFVAAWTRGKSVRPLRELVGMTNPELTPLLVHRHLKTASRLRTWLVCAAEGRICVDAILPASCEMLCHEAADKWTNGLVNPDSVQFAPPNSDQELTWMGILIARLQERPSNQLSRMFHVYILLMNEYYQLLVQSEMQYGFDQFQKFTLSALRDPAEEEFRTRFHALHGRSVVSKVNYLEGRFAPKDKLHDAVRLFRSILGGYLDYLYDVSDPKGAAAVSKRRSLGAVLAQLEEFFEATHQSQRTFHRLALVAHFIKQPWAAAHRQAGRYRHYALDRRLRRAASVLLLTLSKWPKLQTWVRGIDAAANELHAPPDIFAPVFRVCRQSGLTRRTFHVGEDFRHLLVGIASMWEALCFLDLHDGDRIGHGTAMGISPRIWLERMPLVVTVSYGEWMLGLLASWQLLRDLPDMYAVSARLQRELEEVANWIFGRSLSPVEIGRAMALRGLDRLELMRVMDGASTFDGSSLSSAWQRERETVQKTCAAQSQDVHLLWEWLSVSAVQERAEAMVAKPTDFLSQETYVRLQQALMQQIARRGVLVETLPSSNVRISQYHHVKEHHALRWMQAPGHVHDGDPEIMVCLGSDDPGIFAADLETEFHLLYSSLRECGLSDAESLHRLRLMNERGRIYRFHHQSLA